jgi:hypothetical protein
MFTWFHKQEVGIRQAIIAGLFSLAIVVVCGFGYVCTDWVLQAPKLRKENAEQAKEIVRLQTQVAPFIALTSENKYTGDENERLQELASEISKARIDIDAVKKYSDVARMDPLGKQFDVGSGLQENTPISVLLEGTWQPIAGQFVFSTDAAAEKKYREVVEKFPTFPFAYVYISDCLRVRNDPAWKEYANKAIDILEKTTSLAAHKVQHDQALQMLKQGVMSAPVAQMDMRGEVGGLTCIISEMLDGTWENVGKNKLGEEGISFRTDAAAEKKYSEVVEKFPTFPFAYVYISDCLRARNDPAWKEYAHKAIDILEKTTSLAGHRTEHDRVLEKVKHDLQTKP